MRVAAPSPEGHAEFRLHHYRFLLFCCSCCERNRKRYNPPAEETMSDARSTLRFWGARGTMPTPGADHLRYGGNTSCLSVALGEHEHLILDCGSGLRMFGKALGPAVKGISRRFHILLSHYHFDHIEGLPYFSPLYDEQSSLTFHGFDPAGSTIRQTLEAFIRAPYFPVSLAGTPSKREYVTAGPALDLDGLRISSLQLNHPDGSLAWRIDKGRHRVVYATDHEHGHEPTDRALEEFSEGADLLVYDATYIPAEYESLRRGWGHSTWYAAVALARTAKVKRLVLFHHHPDHTDDEMDKLLTYARADFPATDLAHEGMAFSF